MYLKIIGLAAMAKHIFAVCTENSGYEVSLELRKIYEILLDPSAATHGQLRVIDESGEDYLYPASFFTSIDLPQKAVQQMFDAA